MNLRRAVRPLIDRRSREASSIICVLGGVTLMSVGGLPGTEITGTDGGAPADPPRKPALMYAAADAAR